MAKRAPQQTMGVVCAPGLEDICAGELDALGIRSRRIAPGMLESRVTTRQVYLATVWLRTASRVLLRIGSFEATSFEQLEHRAGSIDWDAHLGPDVAPAFRITSHRSALYHTDAIAERLHRFVGPPAPEADPDDPDAEVVVSQSFVVRLDRDTVTVSVDVAGDGLHLRPWRHRPGRAPIRATLAAGALGLLGWNGQVPLCDPFCGSGTIPIEAALLAARRPPGGSTGFAFQHWPSFEPGTWASVNAHRPADPPSLVPITGYDRDEDALARAHDHVEAAEVGDTVTIARGAISELSPDDGAGLLLANPPYGNRLNDGDLRPLYQRFGTVAAERRPGWGLAVIVPDDRRLLGNIDTGLTELGRFSNGGTTVIVAYRPPVSR